MSRRSAAARELLVKSGRGGGQCQHERRGQDELDAHIANENGCSLKDGGAAEKGHF